MKVSVKDFAVSMDIKNKGVELEIRDMSNSHVGDLIITKKWLIWCKGRTRPANGIKVRWRDFIADMKQRRRKKGPARGDMFTKTKASLAD